MMLRLSAWKCETCGYVHQGVQAPEFCPLCGVGPELFESIEIVNGKIVKILKCAYCGLQKTALKSCPHCKTPS